MRKAQANSNHCFVCGVKNPSGLKLRFYETGPGEITVDHVVPEEFQGYPGVVHGGIVAAMLDEACGRCHMTGDSPRFMFTAKLDIRYRKNVPVGQPIRIVGRAGRSKARTAEGSATIYDQEGTILAEANAIMVDVPLETLQAADPETLGWKVYPDEEWDK